MPNVLTDPDVVYHYTSAATLLKIVESESIWATHLQYLNDITESTHCIKALRRRVDNFLVRNPSDFGVALRAALDTAETNFQPTYVTSFSTVPDSLPLWRSYCPNGNGVSIGFRMSVLEKSALTSENPPKGSWDFPLEYSTIRPVEYLDLNDFQLQDKILRECLDEVTRYRAERNAEPLDERLELDDEEFLRWEISSRSCLVKHAGFETESEIRLIAPPRSFSGASVKFRCPRTTVIPYFEVFMPQRNEQQVRPVGIPLGQKDNSYFIDNVIVGPTPNPDLTVNAIKLLFESKQVDDVTVLESDIPFRDL